MTKNKFVWQAPPLSVVRGSQEQATYVEDPDIPGYSGNPLIEAMPPIMSKQQVRDALAFFPAHHESQRYLPDEKRIHLLDTCREFFLPHSIHWEIHTSISNMIRRGYIGRNPITPGHWAQQSKEARLVSQNKASLPSKARGFTIVGSGGVGKSTAVERDISLYPQVIEHTSYRQQDLILKQLVWVKIQCPGDGSLGALCKLYIEEVDDILKTNYMSHYKRGSDRLGDLLTIMARVASNHFLGVLIIDEIQDLSEAKSGGSEHMLNFFVNLENRLGIPFVLIGTEKALILFDGEFRQARRVSEQGDIMWFPMREVQRKKVPDEKDVIDPDWNTFVRAMWKYWYLKHDHPLPADLLMDESVQTLYKKSKGITALVGTIFRFAQQRAINSGEENVTPDVIKSAVLDNQHLIDKLLERCQAGEYQRRKPRTIIDLDPGMWNAPVSMDHPPANNTGRNRATNSANASASTQPQRTPTTTTSNKGRKTNEKATESFSPQDFRSIPDAHDRDATSARPIIDSDHFARPSDFLDQDE